MPHLVRLLTHKKRELTAHSPMERNPPFLGELSFEVLPKLGHRGSDPQHGSRGPNVGHWIIDRAKAKRDERFRGNPNGIAPR
jgi:hypothetical protein